MEDLSNIKERLARLEILVVQSKEDRVDIKKTIEDQSERIEEMSKTLHSLDRKIERYEGKFGGILLAVGAVVSFFVLFGKFILSNWESFVAYITKN